MLFWEDTYLFEAKAVVTEVSCPPPPGVDSTGSSSSQPAITCVVLDRTIFYPAGGGQPSDKGVIEGPNNSVFNVTDVKLRDRTVVLHFIEADKGTSYNLQVGDEVIMKIDKEKRILHAKLHSAGHLLDSALANIGVELVPGKGYHYPDRPYVEYTGKVAAEKRAEVSQMLEAEANRIIQAGGPVEREMAQPNRVEELCGSFPEYLPKDKEARMINVGGVWCPCGGTHVKDTKEIGGLKIDKITVQKNKTRVCYSVL